MKKKVIILGSIVFAVIVLWSGAWLVAAGLVKQGIDAQAQADGLSSPQVTCGTLSVGGFPSRFDVDCAQARIVSGDLVLDVPGIRASVRVYAPTHVLASALGPMQLTDTFTGLRNAVDWSGLEASGRLDNWRIARVSIEARDMVWSDTLFGDVLIAQAPLVGVHLFDIPEQHDAERRLAALAGYVTAENVNWPGLTLEGTKAEVQLELSGLPDDVRNWGDPSLLPGMAASGGTLKVVSIHGTDANSTLDAEGALTLDPQGQVEGQISIASTGVAERIGPLLAEPWRTLVLGTPGEDGSHTNQLNFRDGGIYSGLVPIAAIPPLF